jgi:hypothetical protein
MAGSMNSSIFRAANGKNYPLRGAQCTAKCFAQANDLKYFVSFPCKPFTAATPIRPDSGSSCGRKSLRI